MKSFSFLGLNLLFLGLALSFEFQPNKYVTNLAGIGLKFAVLYVWFLALVAWMLVGILHVGSPTKSNTNLATAITTKVTGWRKVMRAITRWEMGLGILAFFALGRWGIGIGYLLFMLAGIKLRKVAQTYMKKVSVDLRTGAAVIEV